MRSLFGSFLSALSALLLAGASAADGNRLTYLDGSDPFHVGRSFPKLATPQWVGEEGVDAVVILSIDDMRDPAPYENWLRPLIERLKQIDGRAPVSIFSVAPDPRNPQLQTWLKEGLSLEIHTLTHPCPLLQKSNFVAAADTYHGCVDLLNQVPGNKAVAFRMPCCDSMNSPSPRFFAEIFNRTNQAGQFLTISSSVMNITTLKDESLPRDLLYDADGKERFRKYVPFPSFVTTIEDYPYPYVVGRLCWEFPAMAPSDWEAQHIHGFNNPKTVEDWKAALDVTVLKQGTFSFIFHPHGWIKPEQLVEVVDYATSKYGKRVKFLNFREAQERIDKHLLAGNPLRASDGSDNGVRLLDVNNDGWMDVVIGNERLKQTRLWDSKQKRWRESDFPMRLDSPGAQFGVVASGSAILLHRTESFSGAWRFDGTRWVEDRALLNGLVMDGQLVLTSRKGRDGGVRFRDVDRDGSCELILDDSERAGVFAWSDSQRQWQKLAYVLPPDTAIVDRDGRDAGLRFVDVNEDGYDDALFSNAERFSLHLFMPKLYLGFQPGWSREILSGKRGDSPVDIPMIVRGGDAPNNGAWFHSRHMWVQNEDVAHMTNVVDRRSFQQLLAGLQPPAKTPQQALESMRLRPGFKIELVAAEPLVVDPIAFEWSADGRLWVAEMGDYPLGPDGKGSPGGRIRFLEDSDGDGRYDQSTVFLDKVAFPTGVMPWGKGVLISAAPDILYAEDTNGDGKADKREVLFTGFGEGNQQHRFNGFEWGLDGWIYGANGDSGGNIAVQRQKAEGERQNRVSISGRDFRFRIETGEFEAIEGQTQFGRRRDDWGNWFGNNNPTWGWHFFLPERYVARNPHLPVRTLRRYFADHPDATRVYPTARLLQRFNDIGMAGHVTSGCSPAPYRDDLFGPEFASSIFVSEPVHNLVHHEVLQPDGVSFRGRRPKDEEKIEFLASSDSWFRPIMVKAGPDGALYVADMYRLVIEHPEWIPADSQKAFDLRAGADLGRIYRVYPDGATLRKPHRLDKLDTAGLVAALDSPSGWQRDTVQQLLISRADRSAIEPLKNLLAVAGNPKARLQALCTLAGLGVADAKVLTSALRDSHASVREWAIQFSEHVLNPAAKRTGFEATSPKQVDELGASLVAMVQDPELRVRYQLALTLGEWSGSRAAQGLAALAARDAANAEMQLAILSSAGRHLPDLVQALAAAPVATPEAGEFAGKIAALAVTSGDDRSLQPLLKQIGAVASGKSAAAWQFTAFDHVLDAAERRTGGAASIDRSRVLNSAADLLNAARTTAAASDSDADARRAAIRILGRTGREQDVNALAGLMTPATAADVQLQTVEALGRSESRAAADLLIARWKRSSPELRAAIINALSSRPPWIEQLVRAIEAHGIAASEIGPTQRQQLIDRARGTVRQKLNALFVRPAARGEVLKQFEPALSLKGDSTKGVDVFKQHCATCHRYRGEGFEVGPDLAMVAGKSPQALIEAILDPNAAVETRYASYTVSTKAGRELSGVIAAETANSITIRMSGGIEEVVLRSDIEELSGSGLSLMPEGLETAMKPQDVADLIAFLSEALTPTAL